METNLVKQVLCAYGNASWQCVNYAKSYISFSRNVNEDTAQQICTTLGVMQQKTMDHIWGCPQKLVGNAAMSFGL